MNFHKKFQDNNRVTAGIQNGVRDTLIKHKAMGLVIAVWRDGKTVLFPAEDIEILALSPSPLTDHARDSMDEMIASLPPCAQEETRKLKKVAAHVKST